MLGDDSYLQWEEEKKSGINKLCMISVLKYLWKIDATFGIFWRMLILYMCMFCVLLLRKYLERNFFRETFLFDNGYVSSKLGIFMPKGWILFLASFRLSSGEISWSWKQKWTCLTFSVGSSLSDSSKDYLLRKRVYRTIVFKNATLRRSLLAK